MSAGHLEFLSQVDLGEKSIGESLVQRSCPVIYGGTQKREADARSRQNFGKGELCIKIDQRVTHILQSNLHHFSDATVFFKMDEKVK